MEIEIQGLQKRYGPHFGLRVPSLQIAEGTCVGLVGNNGAGKTTFLRLLLDLMHPDEGRVLIGGQEVSTTDAWKPDVGSFLDKSFLLDFLTPLEFLTFTGRLYGRTPDELDALLGFYGELFEGDLLGRRAPLIRDLSTGNQKKIGLVGALLASPRLLVLDEPFANLDPGSQLRLRRMLQQQHEDFGTTILVSSHDLLHVSELCTRVVLIEHGQIMMDRATSHETLPELQRYFAA